MSSISDSRITDVAGAARPAESLLRGLAAAWPLWLATREGTAASAVVTMVAAVENDGREPGVICTNTNGDCSIGGSIASMGGDGGFVAKATFSGSVSIETIQR